MGNLPAARLRPNFLFECAGVHYAGPISTQITKHQGKGTCKGYIILFICFSTRAVHSELVEDYMTEAFISVF